MCYIICLHNGTQHKNHHSTRSTCMYLSYSNTSGADSPLSEICPSASVADRDDPSPSSNLAVSARSTSRFACWNIKGRATLNACALGWLLLRFMSFTVYRNTLDRVRLHILANQCPPTHKISTSMQARWFCKTLIGIPIMNGTGACNTVSANRSGRMLRRRRGKVTVRAWVDVYLNAYKQAHG